jgi:hypothetical protein
MHARARAPAVTTPQLRVSASPEFDLLYFTRPASSYGAKAFCHYEHGAALADAR